MDDYLDAVRAFRDRTSNLLNHDPDELRQLFPNAAEVAARLLEVQEGVRLLRVALGDEPLRGEIRTRVVVEDLTGKETQEDA